MKYTKQGLRVFVPYETGEATIENIRKAWKKYFYEHCHCDFLAVKMGSSCNHIDQLSSLKITLYPHQSIIKFQNNFVSPSINYQVSK